MKNSIHLLALVSVIALGNFPAAAFANVSAFPSFYDFGSVVAGRSSGTTITFMNNSPIPVQFFNVSCSGDFSAYSCFSMCSYLPAYGSCSVRVQFNPRNGDGLRKMIWLNGFGGGQFASATVYGTDKKSR